MDEFEMYQKLIENAANDLLDDTSSLLGYDDYEEADEFITSKEIVKNKEKIKERGKDNSSFVSDDNIDETFVHYKRYSKPREHKYTDKEMEEIRKSCEATYVHDYGKEDIYHLSDEVKKNNDMLAEIRDKLSTVVSSYRNVDRYVKAMRIVVEAWEILSKYNYIHSDKEFFELVAKGVIVAPGIIMPKLRKMNSYNKEMLIKYISNPELDPADLMPKKIEQQNDPWYDQYKTYDDDSEESILYRQFYDDYVSEHSPSKDEEKDFDFSELFEKADEYARDELSILEMHQILSPQEVEFIDNNTDNPPKLEVSPIPKKYIKNYDTNVIGGKKNKGGKKYRYSRDSLADLLNKIQNNPNLVDSSDYTSSYVLSNSMFDIPKEPKDAWDDLYFNGSWTDDAALELYDINVRERLMQERPIRERYSTFADKDLDKFFKTLEAAGINTIDLRRRMQVSDSATAEAISEKERKQKKKTEEELLKHITELNNSSKFKKIVHKAEKALNDSIDQQ